MRQGRRQLGVTMALAAFALLVTSPVRAQSDRDETILLNPPPLAFIVLDTSVSMEYTAAGLTPDCSSATPEKNRWLMAVEALTGTFVEPTCTTDTRTDTTREDYGQTPAVAHTVWSSSDQVSDGILDALSDKVAFGLMTFDPNAGPAIDALGGWSYYNGAPGGSSGGSAVDLGIKNDATERGGLVHPCVEPDESCLDTRAADIQDRILQAIPYGGTPIGATLADIASYFETEPVVQPWGAGNPTGDPFADCRNRTVVLIVNGGPDFDGQYGYEYAAVEAENLYADHGVVTFVVAFMLDDSAVDLPILSEIAYHGGTGAALTANSQSELRAALGTILGAVSFEVRALGEPLVTDATRSTETRQIRLYSGTASVSDSPLDRQGILEQELWGCDESCSEEPIVESMGLADDGLGLCEILDIGDILTERSPTTRELYTVVGKPTGGTSPSLRQIRYGAGYLQADDMELPNLGRDYPKVALWHLYGNYVQIPGTLIGQDLTTGIVDPAISDAQLRQTYAEELIEFIRGGPTCRRQSAMLGAIESGGPAIQSAPYPITGIGASYLLYAQSNEDRPTVAYVATHEGLVHAFRIDRDESMTAADYGEELWAFMPGFALRRLHTLADNYGVLLDGKIAFAEVLPRRNDANSDPAVEAEDWMSLLVVPSGEDDRALFALDVTHPEIWSSDKFLWEISHEGRCVGGGSCLDGSLYATSDFSKLGYQSTRPLIGKLYINEGETPKETTIVVVAGGRDPADANLGRVVYVIDAATGEKIVEFSDDEGNVDGGDSGATLDAYPVTGSPVGYSTGLGGYLSRAFVGDAGGRIWRLDFDSPDPSTWRLRLFDDAYDPQPENWVHRQPVLEPPALAVSSNVGRLVVLYATGAAESDTSPANKYRLRSVIETFDGDDIVATENWEIEFENGELPVGTPVVFDSVAYFTTYVRTTDLCDAGTARLWGVDYMLLDPSENLPIARLDEDGDLLTTEAKVRYIEEENTVPLGVRVVREPACDLMGSDVFDSLPGSVFDGTQTSAGSTPGLGGMRLLVQTRGGAGDTPQNSPPTGAGGKDGSSLGRIVRSLPSPSAQVVLESWATIFE